MPDGKFYALVVDSSSVRYIYIFTSCKCALKKSYILSISPNQRIRHESSREECAARGYPASSIEPSSIEATGKRTFMFRQSRKEIIRVAHGVRGDARAQRVTSVSRSRVPWPLVNFRLVRVPAAVFRLTKWCAEYKFSNKVHCPVACLQQYFTLENVPLAGDLLSPKYTGHAPKDSPFRTK